MNLCQSHGPITPTYRPLPHFTATVRTPLANTRRYARYAETHPVQPLKGLREPHAASVSYRALAPYGANRPLGIEGCQVVLPQSILNSEFLILNWTYTFSAKEKDSETGLSYFGSRYHSSDLSIWLNVDPMAAKYPGLSPYTYCANNPVKLVDPNGETWDTPEDEKKANELISKAEEQILQYKEQIQRCYARYDRFKNPQKKNDELKKIDFLNVLIDEVQKGIDGLNQMCEDEYYYHFVEIGRGRNCYSKKEVRGPKDVHIIIYSDDLIETRWHECKHIQDWLNKVFPGEEHDFGKDNTLGNSNEDVETSAYRSEFAFSRRRFDGQCLIKQGNINDIQGDQRVKKR